MTLRVLALNCTLKAGDQESSTQLLLSQVLEAFRKHDAAGEIMRIAELNVLPGDLG